MPGDDTDSIDIVRVQTRQHWKCFHALPARIQSSSPAWIRPLRLQVRQLWAPRNPFFRHARARAWLALRCGIPVGRISAQIDELQAAQGRPEVGHFGQLEGIDDQPVFERLLETAGEWLARNGKRVMQGPFDLSINQQCGMLVDGFEHRPMMLMNYNPPYYPRRVEAAGLAPVVDLLAYRGATDYALPARIGRLLDRYSGRIVTEPVPRSALSRYSEPMREIFNAAWAGNWGFVPFTRAEFARAVSDMKLLVRPGYVQFARLDGRPAGFIVSLPDLNELIADLDGRLWPTGAVRLLWRIARKRGSRIRVVLMGVMPEHQQTMAGAAISYALIEAMRVHVLADGVPLTEQSWIVEDNTGMRSMVEAIDMHVAQRFRIYSKTLAA